MAISELGSFEVNNSLRVLTLAGDPGGGAAIAPVIERLSETKTVHAYAYRQSVELFWDRGINCEAMCESTSDADFHKLLDDVRPDVVLSATSVNGVDLERKLIRAAYELEIPSVSVLDFWANYRSRFADADGELRYLPNRIAVMDAKARESMIVAGFPEGIITITGQPALDHLTNVIKSKKRQRRIDTRSALGIDDTAKLVVFMSQPLEEFYRDYNTDQLPPAYNEKTVFADLISAANDNESIRIVIKPHPREVLDSWKEVLEEHSLVSLDSETNSHDLALAADRVVGMTSMILVECAMLGCRVISVQSGEAESKNPFVGFPNIYFCNTYADFDRAFRAGSSKGNPQGTIVCSNATKNVVDVLYTLKKDVRGRRKSSCNHSNTIN